MVQIKHFRAPQKMPNFQFSRRTNWPWRDKILSVPQRGKKIIVNQRKPILVGHVACSSCSEEKSPMVRFPDPKQY